MKRFYDFTRRSVSASFAGLILLLLSCAAFSTTARAQAAGVSPILECVTSAFSAPGRSRVYFGYRNTTNDPQFFESGSAANYFTPVPNDRDQPSTFQAGEHRAVFYVEVAFSVTTSLTWNLGGSAENEPGHFVTATAASPQCRTDVITYQGRLTASGGQASGNYDFQFQLFDAATGGSATSALISAANVNVSNGVFTVPLDFGVSALRTPRTQYLEIGVRASGGGGAYTTLAPRQPLTDAPSAVFAAFAASANDAEKLGGVSAGNYVLNGDSRLSDARTPTAGSGNYIQNTTSTQTGNFNISGSGTIGGTLSADKLAGNGVLARGGAPGGNGVNNNGYAFNGNGGDNDSGLFSEVNGRVSLFTDSIERVRVDGSGLNVTGNITATGTINGVVRTVNGLNGAVTLAGGSGITVTPSGNTITLSLTGTSMKKFVVGGLAGGFQYDVVHNLNTVDVIVQVYDQNGNQIILGPTVNTARNDGFAQVRDANTVRVGLFPSGTYRVVIIG